MCIFNKIIKINILEVSSNSELESVLKRGRFFGIRNIQKTKTTSTELERNRNDTFSDYFWPNFGESGFFGK